MDYRVDGHEPREACLMELAIDEMGSDKKLLLRGLRIRKAVLHVKERRDIKEQFEWWEKRPELMKPLMN